MSCTKPYGIENSLARIGLTLQAELPLCPLACRSICCTMTVAQCSSPLWHAPFDKWVDVETSLCLCIRLILAG